MISFFYDLQGKSLKKNNINLWGKIDPDVDFYITGAIKLTDTIRFEYKGKTYKVYDFENHIVERVSQIPI